MSAIFFKAECVNSANDSEIGNIMVDKKRCPQNHRCPSIKVCPVGALTQKGYAAPAVDTEKCIRCGKCVKFCPKRAILFSI